MRAWGLRAIQKITVACRCCMINVNPGNTQGDAHLLQAPDGTTVLIDAGSAATAQTVLLPFLAQTGVKRIDTVIVTHPHYDHYEGVLPLLRSGLPIGRILMNPIGADGFQREWWAGKYDDVLAIGEEARRRGIPVAGHDTWQTLALSDSVCLEKLQCLTPDDFTRRGIRGDMNDLSLVTVLRVRNRPVVFYAADINVASGEILAGDPTLDFTCDIVKFPHHGAESFGGDGLIERLQPKAVLFPTPPSIWDTARCAKARGIAARLGAAVYSNAVDGHVTVILNHDGSWHVECEHNASGIKRGGA